MIKKILVTLIVVVSVLTSKAQIVNVCGSDSVTLAVDNYSSGLVQWQESIDNINWVNIPEISGILYKFHPTQTKYYRAAVITSGCAPLYSAVSFVQLPPIAHAGDDRVIGNATVTLLGNNILGTSGEWTILSGNGGSLDDSTKPSAILTGKDKETYQLKWTLTNSCGQSSDTVKISFDGIIVQKKFIVVDNTDKLYSDSTEMSTGTYRIKFSNTTITPYDSVMLIGMRQDYSFLRRVTGFTQKDSIFTFSTVQGSLENLIQSGVLNLGDAVNKAMIGDTAQFKNSTVFPTRETLKNRSNKNGFELLYATPLHDKNYLPLKSSASSINPGGFQLTLQDKTYTDITGFVKLSFIDSYIKVVPNFVFDYTYNFPFSFSNLKFGIDNGILEYNYKTVLEGSVQHDFINDDLTLGDFRLDMVGAVYTLPVWVTIHFKLMASCNIGVSAALKFEQTKNYKKYLTALVTGDDDKHLSFNPNSNDEMTVDEKMVLKGELNSELKIGPEISFDLYGIPGPYFKLPLKINTGICANANGNWDSETSFGLDGEIGAKAEKEVWGVTFSLFNFHYPLITNLKMGSYIMPYHLELLSGNFQSGTAGSKLSNPISLKVTNNHGTGIPLVPVRFELDADNGSVTDQVLYTDGQGIVNANWTLGIKPQNSLRARVLDCSNSDIDNSPLIISANATSTTYDCTNSNLFISQKSNQSYTYPSVSGGKAPYTYSTNGTDYSVVVPMFPNNISVKKLIYVKDNNQCVRSKTININPLDPCANSTLYLEALIQPDILTLTGKLGTAPYTYSLDNATSFTATKIYNKLTAGKHIIYVKDALGCVYSKEIVLDPQTTASIQSSYPLQGATSIPVSGITFKWFAGTYSASQVYDLYLKKDNAAYSLIASDLNTNSFTYMTLLASSGAYTWKVVVKGSTGIMDFSEFTFTTANGVATTPIAPVLLQPTNNATSVTSPVTIKWTAQAGDFTYDLYLDTSDGSKLVALNLTTAEYVIDKLESGKFYYWKVKIKSKLTGQSAMSNVWSFTNNNSYFICGNNLTITHTLGDGVSPETKTVNYGTVKTSLSGTTNCWITQNLGSTNQANSATDATDAAGGWYWQFNRKQGYTQNGSSRIPNTWGGFLSDSTDWLPTNDPCTIELGSGWRIPTSSEWIRTNTNGSWKSSKDTYNSVLKIHSAGIMGYVNGVISSRGGLAGMYWSSTSMHWSSTITPNYSWNIHIDTVNSIVNNDLQSYGFPIRCIQDIPSNTIPIISTIPVNNITPNTARSGGNLTSDGGGTITARGICWSKSPNPTVADFKTLDYSLTSSLLGNLTQLTVNTTYYIRAYATNLTGTGYGNQVVFTTSNSIGNETVSDVEGNIYHTVTIGKQEWLVENLMTTKYNDGTSIPEVDKSYWVPFYCWYNNLYSFRRTYGALYNYYVVTTGKLCPLGWYVPGASDWATLTGYLGGDSLAGGKMKETGTTHWTSPNNGATNESGFTGLPGGYQGRLGGSVDGLGLSGSWWSSTEFLDNYNSRTAMQLGLSNLNGIATRYNGGSEKTGRSVRCLKYLDSKTLPVITTASTSNITTTTATSGGNVTSDGGGTVTAHGICWNSTGNPSLGDNIIIDGSGVGNFSRDIVGLKSNTTYYIRAYATNSVGTSYGDQQIIKTDLRSSFSNIEMAFVQGGTFQMGSNDYKLIHEVTLSDFNIGNYEITNAQWQDVMGSLPMYYYPGDNLPVYQVSWDDVQTFISKLNIMTGKSYRLPTEAEWEYAARGGNKSKGYLYSGSNLIDEVAWYYLNWGDVHMHRVGTKKPNELGIFDMSGNASEYCSDFINTYPTLDLYPGTPETNPKGIASSNFNEHVIRGSSAPDMATTCRGAVRANEKDGGFRLVLPK